MSEVEVSFVVEKGGCSVVAPVWSKAGGGGRGDEEAAKSAPGASKRASRAPKEAPRRPQEPQNSIQDALLRCPAAN